jgi:hypothetical protein
LYQGGQKMRIYAMGGGLGFIALVLTMCGGQAPIAVSTPRPAPGAGVAPLASPKTKVAIPVPETNWTPVSYGSSRGENLVAALRDLKTLALILPKKGNPAELENRVFRMLKAASPDTRVVARGVALLDKLLEERGDIPYRVTMEPGGTDAYGRPYYVPKDHPLNTSWLSKKRELKGAEAMLVVRPIRVSTARLRELREQRTGGCSGIEKTLQEGVDAGRTFFQEYEEKASLALAKEFGRHLDAALPFWRSELDKVASLSDAGSRQSACSEAYTQLLNKYEVCIAKSCPVAPKLFADSGGVIGMPNPELAIPPFCPVAGMRDYATEISDLADRAVTEVLPALDAGWAGELARFGGLTRMQRVVTDTCAPRHRRFHEAALEDARNLVVDYFKELGEQEITATWASVGGMVHVPGVGPVKVYARVKVSAGDSSAQAVAIETRFRELERCSAGDERILQATLVDVGSSEVRFMGLFFEEQLLCEDFLPN